MGLKPTELRHLVGRIGELYAALITNGQMATEVNQHGYDVVSASGERVSVKTTAKMGASGYVSFNPNTLNQVDRVIILRINTDEMQIETLINESIPKAIEFMGNPDANGKVNVALSRLLSPRKPDSEMLAIKQVKYRKYQIVELENGTIEVKVNDEVASPSKPVLREIATSLNISHFNSNGNQYNTRQLGSLIIKTIKNSGDLVGA
ncbi:hypothetical protein [Microbulbifer sp. GL-2]|uniref:DUF6998 domain-containing protein n=1 Tax=Microbulbifer sp. GL-2 TaxID=2591606 RepID=UPI001164BFE3|nr:hypothetical protein [Microbulbifer sp. GL-2]BBM03243.1 hypothetical protein GL2_33170 [Microbulbifer sp. GL-2]